MKKNLVFIITAIAVATLIIISLLIKNTHREAKSFKTFDKYSLAITLRATKDDKTDTYLITTKDDGTTMQISANRNVPTAYIKDKSLFYTKYDEFHTFNTESSYRDLQRIVSNFKQADIIAQDDDNIKYTKILNPAELDTILKACFISKKSLSNSVASFTVKFGKIIDFKISIDTEDQYLININLKFEPLDSEFVINVPTGQGVGHKFQMLEDENNVYEFIK